MIERLNQNNFKSVSVVKNESFEDFKQYITDKGLNINCFYINPEECYINRTWYIEDYITIPIFMLSKEYIDMMRLVEMVDFRRRTMKKLIMKQDYIGIFAFIENSFKISYFLDLYTELEDSKFLELFKFVYSSCEYDFHWILKTDIVKRIEETRNIENIKEELHIKYNIEEDIITIYRGEADKSTHFKDGAISWTLDCDIASFFANRFNAQNPKIYKAKVNVEDILMLIDREQEVLVTEDKLFDIQEL